MTEQPDHVPTQRADRRSLALLILLVVAGLGLRFWNLGLADWTYDAAFHVHAADSMLETGEPLLPSGEPYRRSRLVTWLGALSFDVLGRSEATSRVPSVLLGSCVILVIFFGARRFVGDGCALAASALYALSPFAIESARVFRYYGQWHLCGALAFFALVRLLEKPLEVGRFREFRFSTALPTLGAAALALVTLLIGRGDNILIAGLVVGCGLMVAVRAASEARGGVRSVFQKSDAWILLFAGMAGVAFAAANPDQVKRYYWATVKYQPFAAEAAGDPLYYFKILVGDDPLFPLWAALGGIALWRRPGAFGRFLLAGIFVPLLLMSTLFQFRVDRFMGFLFPLLCVLIAAGLVQAATLLRTRLSGSVASRRVIVGGLLVAWAALVPWPRRIPEVVNSKTGVYRGYSRSEFRTALAGILPRVHDSDAVVTGSALLVSCYIGRLADYALTDTFGEHDPEPSRHYSGAMRIRSQKEMESVFASRARGWLIVQDEIFRDSNQLSPKLRAFILERTREEYAGDQNSVLVRSWGVEDDTRD